MNEAILRNFADKLVCVSLNDIYINKNKFNLQRGHNYSINNQDGVLSEINLFGKELEFIMVRQDMMMPISIQLYENISGYYRVFVYNNKGMLTSVNLSTGYTDGVINLEILLKLSTRDMTKEERNEYRDMLVVDIEREGIEIIKKNTVYLGKYDVVKDEFIDTNAKTFLEQLIKVAVIKGHYMKNKGYELSIL